MSRIKTEITIHQRSGYTLYIVELLGIDASSNSNLLAYFLIAYLIFHWIFGNILEENENVFRNYLRPQCLKALHYYDAPGNWKHVQFVHPSNFADGYSTQSWERIVAKVDGFLLDQLNV